MFSMTHIDGKKVSVSPKTRADDDIISWLYFTAVLWIRKFTSFVNIVKLVCIREKKGMIASISWENAKYYSLTFIVSTFKQEDIGWNDG